MSAKQAIRKWNNDMLHLFLKTFAASPLATKLWLMMFQCCIIFQVGHWVLDHQRPRGYVNINVVSKPVKQFSVFFPLKVALHAFQSPVLAIAVAEEIESKSSPFCKSLSVQDL